MSRKLKVIPSQENESEDSLLLQVQKRQNQRKLADHLSDSIRYEPPIRDPNDFFRSNKNDYAGFSNANEFFKSSQKKQHQGQNNFHQNQEIQSKLISNHSTITMPRQKLQQKDTKLNKQIQKPIIRDIQDLDKNCGGCRSKPQVGLNYKDRNRKLIKQHQEKVYHTQKTQQPEQFNTPEKKQALNMSRINFNEFQYNETNLTNNSIAGNLFNRINDNTGNNSIDPSKKFNFIIEKARVESQKKLNIQGHTVYFPYQPYDAQLNYMGKVIESLEKKQNAILESPTGTGKTLCLLSAALSWVQNEFWKTYKQVSIVYLSRTHSQLAQVQKELEKTCFRPTMATFGSRQILCIKQELSQLKGRDKVEACSKGVKLFIRYGKDQRARRQLKFDVDETDEQRNSRMLSSSKKKLSDYPPDQQKKVQQAMCSYYAGQRVVLDLARTKFKNKIITTEKIKQLGETYNFCPYYYPTFVKPICNLFLMPYNYLLDQGLNEKYKTLIKDSILIFDEAHNVPQSSCDGRSFSINKKTFQDAKKELTKLIKGEKSSQQLWAIKADYEFQINSIQQQVDRIFTRINNFITQVQFPEDQRVTEDDNTQKKMFRQHQTQQKVYELLYEKCYDHERKIFQNLPNDKSQRDLIKKMAKEIEPDMSTLVQLCQKLSETPDGIFQNMQKVGGFVKKCIRLILQQPDCYKWMERQVSHYRLMVKKMDKHWQIQMVCLVPFLTMKNISQMQPRNIILTSGTLSSIDTWQNELGIPFPIRFSNTHVISPDQLMLRVLTGEDKSFFNFSYKYLQENFKTIYQFTLQSIIKLAQNIPNGMLVITPSYKVMNSLERCMQYNPVLKKRLNSAKKVFTETRDNFQDLIKKYRKAALQQKGALLFCVCRGKISEGIDFPNELCRAVIFVGIPFPNVKDTVISEKKNHYDRIAQREPSYKFSGQKWYQNLTFRSVNQAIGRVIRHINDFGSIFLLDLRYNLPRYKGQLPKWALPSLRAQELKSKLFQQLESFYYDMETKFGNYEGKELVNKSQSQSFETGEDFNQQKQKQQKSQIVTQKISQHFQKVLSKKASFNQYLSKPNAQSGQKKSSNNAFATIMGTNQNKLIKKKSNNLPSSNDFF